MSTMDSLRDWATGLVNFVDSLSPEQKQTALGTAVLVPFLYIVSVGVYRVWFHPLAKFPGPTLLALTSLPEKWKSYITGTWFREVVDLHRKYGPVVRVGPNQLALDGSVGWPQVFAHKTGRPEFLKVPNFYFPHDKISILGSASDVHRRQRRTLAHAFSDANLKEQEDIITKYIEMFLDYIGKKTANGDAINIVDWLNFTTFDIIGDLTFSDPYHSLEGGSYSAFVKAFFQGIRGQSRRRLIDFYPIMKPIIYAVWGKEDFIVEAEQRQLSADKAKVRMALGNEPQGRRDFSDYMILPDRDGKKRMMDHEIMANAAILIGAGSETTATALSGFHFYLGNNPTAYERLTKEIRGAFEEESEITMNSTGRLEYLVATIEEVLRVYPPAAETPPRMSPGANIEGKWVPKGTICTVFQWATFRNPDNFVEPDTFAPERWLPPSHPLYEPRYAKDNKAVFKPFSFGSRDCIGKNLAYSEMRVIIARLLWRYDFRLAPGQEGWQDAQHTFLVWSKGALNIHLQPRTIATK